jgi:hypothetical protein
VPGLARAQCLAERQAELLPVPYFHVVFTVPAQIAEIAFQNKAAGYVILVKAASEALRMAAADPGIWVPRSAWSPCFILGIKISTIVRMSTASCRAAACHSSLPHEGRGPAMDRLPAGIFPARAGSVAPVQAAIP